MAAGNVPIAAIVLAAGRSTRMGGPNKLLLPFGGQTVVETVVRKLAAAGFTRILVVLGHQHERVAAALAGCPAEFCANPDFPEGLSTSVRAGVRGAGPSAAWFLFALGDMPAVEVETLRKLRAAAQATPAPAILAPACGGRRGNPVIFSASFRAALQALSGDEGARPLLQAHAQAVVEVPVQDTGIFRDLDTPSDVAGG